MLSATRSGDNAAPSESVPVDRPEGPASGFSTTGLRDEVPGDFHDFMRDVLGDEPLLTPEEVNEMYCDYLARQRRDALRAVGELPVIQALTLPVRPLEPNAWPPAAA